MSADEDRRAQQRFVAGLPVAPDALATAIAARALDRAVINEALLRNLGSDDALVRRRTAERVARMAGLGDSVAGRLAILAETDPDERTRVAASEALRAHERLDVVEETVRRRRSLAALTFAFVSARSSGRGPAEASSFVPPEPPPGDRFPDARLIVASDALLVQFEELPAAFTGTLPILVVTDDAGVEAELGRAVTPVTGEGAVTIALAPQAGSLREVVARLDPFDLVVRED
jgi:hypothetical protein